VFIRSKWTFYCDAIYKKLIMPGKEEKSMIWLLA
jgi:hypothetical protein